MLSIDPVFLQDGTVLDSSDDIGREISVLEATVQDIRQRAEASGISLPSSFDAMLLDAEQNVGALTPLGSNALSTDASAEHLRLSLPALRQGFLDASASVTAADNALQIALRDYQTLIDTDPLYGDLLAAEEDVHEAEDADNQAQAEIDRLTAKLTADEDAFNNTSADSLDATQALMIALQEINTVGGREQYQRAFDQYATDNQRFRTATLEVDHTKQLLRAAGTAKEETARILSEKNTVLETCRQQDTAAITARNQQLERIDGLRNDQQVAGNRKTSALSAVSTAEGSLQGLEDSLQAMIDDPRFNVVLEDLTQATTVLQDAIDAVIQAQLDEEARRLAHLQELRDDITSVMNDIDETNRAITAPGQTMEAVNDLLTHRTDMQRRLHADREELRTLDSTFSDEGVEEQESLRLIGDLVTGMQQIMARKGDVFSELQPLPAIERQQDHDLGLLRSRLDDLTRQVNARQATVDSLTHAIDDLDAQITFVTDHPESANGGYSPDWLNAQNAFATVEGTQGKRSWAMNISPDGRFLGRGDTTGHMELIDAKTGAILWQGLEEGYLCDISFNADGSKMAAIHSSGYLDIIDTRTHEVVTYYTANNQFFGNMRWMGDEICLALQGVGSIRIINAATGQTRGIDPSSGTNGIAIAGEKIFAGGSYGDMRLFKSDGTLLAEAPSPGNVCTVAASEDGQFFASVTYDGIVTLYDASLHVIGSDTGIGGYKINFLADNKGLVVYDPTGRFVVYDLAQARNGSLGTPVIIPTNTAQGYSNSMAIAPDNSLVFNTDPDNGLRATRLPQNLMISAFERTINDLQTRKYSLQQSLSQATDALTTVTDIYLPVAQEESILSHDRDMLQMEIENLQNELDSLDGQIAATEASMRTEQLRTAEEENGGPLSAAQMDSVLSQVTATFATGEITLENDTLYAITQELVTEFFTLRNWLEQLTVRRSFLEDIAPTVYGDDVAAMQQEIGSITSLINQVNSLLNDVRAAWTETGGTFDALDIPVAAAPEETFKLSPALQSILYRLPLALPDVQTNIDSILGHTRIASTMRLTGPVDTENNNFAHLPFALSLLGGSGMLHAITNYGTSPTMTATEVGIQIQNGNAVLDFSDILAMVTTVSGTVQGGIPGETVFITAYRGAEELSTIAANPDGTFAIENMQGITCVIIHSASKTVSMGAIHVGGDWGHQQVPAEHVDGLNNDMFSRMTAQNLRPGDLNTYKNSISFTRVDSGTFRGHSNSSIGFHVPIDPNSYNVIQIFGTNPFFVGLNYINHDGVGVAFPSNRYQVIGNTVVVFPSGFADQKDIFLWAGNMTNYSNTPGSNREGTLPEISAPPSVGLVEKRVLNVSTPSWGGPVTEGSSRKIVDSFEGRFSITNYSLTEFTVESISVHVGPTGTSADPVTASLNEPRYFGPGTQASFIMPVIMQGFGYDQMYTVYARMSDGTDIRLEGGRFEASRPSNSPPDSRHLAHLAVQGLAAAQTLGLSQNTQSFYAGVINEYETTGTISAGTAYAFTSTPSYTLLAERDNIMATTGEDFRNTLIAYYLTQGKDSSLAAQLADSKIKSIIANPRFFAEQYGVANFDQTNDSFSRLLSGGIAYVNTQIAEGRGMVAGVEMGDIFVSSNMLSDLQENSLRQLIFSSLQVPINRNDGTWYVQEGSHGHVGTEANAVDLNLRYSAMADLGADVRAAADGEIVLIDEADGRMVLRHTIIDPTTGEEVEYYTEYVHMQNMRMELVGTVITAGTKIGEVGRTTAVPNQLITSELHFNIILNGISLDPRSWLTRLQVAIDQPRTGSDREIGAPIFPINADSLEILGINHTLAQGSDWQTIKINGNNQLFSVNPQSNIGSILPSLNASLNVPWKDVMGPVEYPSISNFLDTMTYRFDLFGIDQACDGFIANADALIAEFTTKSALSTTPFFEKGFLIDTIAVLQSLKWSAQGLQFMTPSSGFEVVTYLMGGEIVQVTGKVGIFLIKPIEHLVPVQQAIDLLYILGGKIKNTANFDIGGFVRNLGQALLHRRSGESIATIIEEASTPLLNGAEMTTAKAGANQLKNFLEATNTAEKKAFWQKYVDSISDPITKDTLSILMPSGEPIGTKGSSYVVREVTGNLDDAKNFFQELVRGGTKIFGDTNRITYRMPNGKNLTIRFISEDGSPSININNYMGVEFKKIHFYP